MNTTPVSLLERLRRQPDEQSWRRFVELYEPWLRGQFRRHGLEPADADDIVQEVMTVSAREIASFRHNGRKGAFRTWLRGVTANRLREHWRQRRRLPTTDANNPAIILDQLADDASELSQPWDREHDQHVVSQLLKMIAADFEPKTWRAFRAFVVEGRTATAVATELGITPGAVWTAKSHVLKRLREAGKELLD